MSDPTPPTEYNPNRSANLKVYALLALASLGTLVIFATLDSFNRQPKEIQAGALMTIPVVLVSLCGFTAIGIGATALAIYALHRRPALESAIITQARNITPQRPAPQLAPLQPVHQLPAPIYSDVPVMTYQGKRIPYGMLDHEQALYQTPAEPQITFDPEPTQDRNTVILRTKTTQGQTIEVGAKLLIRFCNCPTPARKEWTGDKKYYGLCSQFAEAHGLLEQTGNGYTWREGYPAEKRSQWINQLIDLATQKHFSPTPNSDEE